MKNMLVAMYHDTVQSFQFLQIRSTTIFCVKFFLPSFDSLNRIKIASFLFSFTLKDYLFFTLILSSFSSSLSVSYLLSLSLSILLFHHDFFGSRFFFSKRLYAIFLHSSLHSKHMYTSNFSWIIYIIIHCNQHVFIQKENDDHDHSQMDPSFQKNIYNTKQVIHVLNRMDFQFK